MSAPFLIYKATIIDRSGLSYDEIDHSIISKDYDMIIRNGLTYVEADISAGVQMQQMMHSIRGEKSYQLPNARRIATKWVTL